MFLLRCALFLSIVYVGIFNGLGSPRSPHSFEATVAGGVTGLTSAALARATDWCAERRVQCVRDAARLTALVETAAAEPASGTQDAVLSERLLRASVPGRDTRRRAARAVLTDVH